MPVGYRRICCAFGYGVGDWRTLRAIAAEATRALFARPDPPDAIFVGNDHMAFAVLETLRAELGRAVPEEVSVVGYDDVAMAAWPSYDLTTLRQPASDMADATVTMLLGMIEAGDAPAGRLEIESPLILRGSARIPEGWPRDAASAPVLTQGDPT